MQSNLRERLFDLEARVEGIFPLAIGDPEGAPEWFEDFCFDADASARAVFEGFSRLAPFASGDTIPDILEVAETVVMSPEISGFVCKLSWCPRRYVGGSAFFSGWGLTRWKWFHGETAEAALDAGLAFVEADHDKALRKAEDSGFELWA